MLISKLKDRKSVINQAKELDSEISKLSKAKEKLDMSVVHDNILELFEQNPALKSIYIDGSWEYNDEGGTELYLSPSFEALDGLEDELAEDTLYDKVSDIMWNLDDKEVVYQATYTRTDEGVTFSQ